MDMKNIIKKYLPLSFSACRYPQKKIMGEYSRSFPRNQSEILPKALIFFEGAVLYRTIVKIFSDRRPRQ